MEIVRIAGIDPGLRFTGYGVVNFDTEKNEIWTSNCGVVKNRGSQYVKGLDAIMHMKGLLKDLSEKECFAACDSIIIEVPAAVYSKNFSSGALVPVAVISGVLLNLFDYGEVIPVYPTVWNRRRKKEVSQAKTQEVLGSYEEWNYDNMPKAKPQFEHIIDAVGMALWYLQTQYIEE